MTIVYMLYHIHDSGDEEKEDQKFIDVYSTEEKAKAAIERLKPQPGFRDYPDDFQIFDSVVDRDGWTEGFISFE